MWPTLDVKLVKLAPHTLRPKMPLRCTHRGGCAGGMGAVCATGEGHTDATKALGQVRDPTDHGTMKGKHLNPGAQVVRGP